MQCVFNFCIKVIKRKTNFFQSGWVADIYTGSFQPDNDLQHLDKLVESLQELSDQNKILKGN